MGLFFILLLDTTSLRIFLKFLFVFFITQNLRGLHHYEDRNRTWHQLISVIHQFTCVHTIHFGAVPGTVLQTLCGKMLQLEELSAEWISDSNDEQMKLVYYHISRLHQIMFTISIYEISTGLPAHNQ